MQTVDAVHHNVVSDVEWTQARKALLAKEKELTRQRDALSAERRALPWRKIETDYVFDGPGGRLTLAELFDGRSQLLVYHFMFSPDWEVGCSSCSMAADHMDSSLIHVIHRDVTLTAVSRAPLAKIEAFKKRMGWRFPWVSSFGSDFNRDYHVSFTREEIANGHAMYNFDSVSFGEVEAPGASVFYKDSHGDVFHTYSSYGRGLEWLIGAYSYLDLVPKGRDEANLAHPMSWVRHHDRYENRPKAPGTCCSAER